MFVSPFRTLPLSLSLAWQLNCFSAITYLSLLLQYVEKLPGKFVSLSCSLSLLFSSLWPSLFLFLFFYHALSLYSWEKLNCFAVINYLTLLF